MAARRGPADADAAHQGRTAPNNATTREQQTIDALFRAADVTSDPDARPAMRAGLELIVALIETRHRRMENGDFADRPHDDD